MPQALVKCGFLQFPPKDQKCDNAHGIGHCVKKTELPIGQKILDNFENKTIGKNRGGFCRQLPAGHKRKIKKQDQTKIAQAMVYLVP